MLTGLDICQMSVDFDSYLKYKQEKTQVSAHKIKCVVTESKISPNIALSSLSYRLLVQSLCLLFISSSFAWQLAFEETWILSI